MAPPRKSIEFERIEIDGQVYVNAEYMIQNHNSYTLFNDVEYKKNPKIIFEKYDANIKHTVMTFGVFSKTHNVWKESKYEVKSSKLLFKLSWLESMDIDNFDIPDSPKEGCNKTECENCKKLEQKLKEKVDEIKTLTSKRKLNKIKHDEGYKNGYDKGYQRGYETKNINESTYDTELDTEDVGELSYDSGFKSGYEEAFMEGIKEANDDEEFFTEYDEGYNEGYNEGVEEGYRVGDVEEFEYEPDDEKDEYTNGYEVGYKSGFRSGCHRKGTEEDLEEEEYLD